MPLTHKRQSNPPTIPEVCAVFVLLPGEGLHGGWEAIEKLMSRKFGRHCTVQALKSKFFGFKRQHKEDFIEAVLEEAEKTGHVNKKKIAEFLQYSQFEKEREERDLERHVADRPIPEHELIILTSSSSSSQASSSSTPVPASSSPERI